MEAVKETTGVDLADVMKAETIDAKINKNVTLNGGVSVD
jgi:flotillin